MTLQEQLAATDDADRYRSGHGVAYARPRTTGSTSIAVLEFLNGKPFNNLVMAYIHGLRPSFVRATHGEVTTDAWPWRVTVMLDENDKVQWIEQEVEVAYGSGFDVMQARRTATP